MSFFAELKRRNVFKVGVAYAVLAWLLIQIIDTVLPTFGAPDWVVPTLILLILLGFPVALFIAWAFEMTPEGIQPTSSVNPEESITPQTGQKLNTLIISVLSLAVVFLVVDNYVLDDPTEISELAEEESADSGDFENLAIADLEKSIAVLPFANLSADEDQEYFSDGLSEEILNKLAQVADLQVAARTSSFYFKGRNEDMREIGQQLGVNYILEGSVRRANDELRITAQLIQAENGFDLWSDNFDRSIEDVFAVQDEIAQAVTQALSITLQAGVFSQPGMTSNVQAYDAFLRSRQSTSQVTAASTRRGVEEMELAISLDPAFTHAWQYLHLALTAAQVFNSQALSEEFAARMDNRIRNHAGNGTGCSLYFVGDCPASWRARDINRSRSSP